MRCFHTTSTRNLQYRESEKLAFRPNFAVLNHRGMYLSGRVNDTVPEGSGDATGTSVVEPMESESAPQADSQH